MMFTKTLKTMQNNMTLATTTRIIVCSMKQIKKVLGMFKEECGGIPIKEYVGPRPKIYTTKIIESVSMSVCMYVCLAMRFVML